MSRATLFVTFCAALLVVHLACDSSHTPVTDGDGDSDGDTDVDGDADGDSDGDSDGDTTRPCGDDDECCEDQECSDGIYCNGVELCDRGLCRVGAPIECDDGLSCTDDECEELANLCVHIPVHAPCDDGDMCNGSERCDPADEDADAGTGCAPGHPMECEDGSMCTEDFCIDGECRSEPLDGDDDGYAHEDCGGTDCDDESPEVNPGAVEHCSDRRDNDCNGLADLDDPAC